MLAHKVALGQERVVRARSRSIDGRHEQELAAGTRSVGAARGFACGAETMRRSNALWMASGAAGVLSRLTGSRAAGVLSSARASVDPWFGGTGGEGEVQCRLCPGRDRLARWCYRRRRRLERSHFWCSTCKGDDDHKAGSPELPERLPTALECGRSCRYVGGQTAQGQ